MLCNYDEKLIIRGKCLEKNDDFFLYSDNDIKIFAYEFLPGKEMLKFTNILDVCNILHTQGKYYVVYGEELETKLKFCF